MKRGKKSEKTSDVECGCSPYIHAHTDAVLQCIPFEFCEFATHSPKCVFSYVILFVLKICNAKFVTSKINKPEDFQAPSVSQDSQCF